MYILYAVVKDFCRTEEHRGAAVANSMIRWWSAQLNSVAMFEEYWTLRSSGVKIPPYVLMSIYVSK